ncbi:OmpA family protein [Candidatus Albibeggiatoa sp. nov. BB20]|uniref:OmpA family protein n=1 Tax=Candidatus Albibeggiatoa sp. nov. BB20 TaxID=3162723 RepID=UPI00336533EE
MPTIVRITILSLILVLEACSNFRFDDTQAFITAASYRSQPEPPIVAARLLAEPLSELPVLASLSIEPAKPIIPDIVENILFESDSSALSPVAIAQLDGFAIVVADGGYQIRVEGHTDSSHSYEYNHALSEARASTVREALIARGILENRLVVDYHGEIQAVATNTNAQGKQQNRRVELRPVKPFSPLAPFIPTDASSHSQPNSSFTATDTSLKPISSSTTTSLKPLSLQTTTSDVEVIDVQLKTPKKLEVQVDATSPTTANAKASADSY